MSQVITAKDILRSKGFSEAQLEVLDTRTSNTLAKKFDSTWVAPLETGAVIEVKTITPKADGKGKFAGKAGQYLTVAFAGKGYQNIAFRLNDGEALTAEGKKLLVENLTSLANGAADVLEQISE